MLWFGIGVLTGGVIIDLMWRWLYNSTVKMYEDRIALDANFVDLPDNMTLVRSENGDWSIIGTGAVGKTHVRQNVSIKGA